MEKLFIFKKAVDKDSVLESNTGTNVDFLAVPIASLANVSAKEGEVVLTFRDGNSYSDGALTNSTSTVVSMCNVTLTVTIGAEYETIRALWTNMYALNNDMLLFDEVKDKYPVSYVQAIKTIIRYESPTYVAGGGSSLPTGGVEDQVLTKLSATDGDADWEYAHTLYVTVRNTSGGTLAKGTPVHATGVTGNVADVIAADASNSSAMPCTYVLNEEITNNSQGVAILTGTIEGIDTSAFSAGDVVYVAAGGGFTNVKPTGTNLIQNLGVVTKSNASTGSGIVYGTGRSNDVPNLPTGKFFIGSATNTTESAYTLPTADGTVNQVLQTNGSGAVTFQTISSTSSVVLASQTAQVRLNINDNYYTGNDDYGWAYPIWLNPSSFSTTFTDFYALMGIIIPKDLTTLDFLSTLSRSNGDGTNATVELFVTDRPNGSTANMTLTSIGSASSGAFSTGVVYNVDIALTGLTLNKGQLLFVGLKKTGGTNITTYAQLNFTIIGS